MPSTLLAGAQSTTEKPGATTPAKPAAPATQTAKPATPAPQTTKPAAPRRATQPAARSGIALTLVDPRGATLPGITVEMTGPVNRDGKTDESGQINFPGLQAGTYRLRFSGEPVITFEREVTLRAGQVEKLSIRLNPAPPPPPPPPPPEPEPPAEPPPPPVGPIGSPQIGSLRELARRELRERSPRGEIVLSCSGNTRSSLVVLTEDQAPRLYEDAEAVYHVLEGDGAIKVGELASIIEQGSFVAVPRGTTYSIARRGNRPLALLAVLSGAPCEVAR